MTSSYNSIARDYHWLVPDELLSGDSFVERHQDLLGSLPRHALILDCACGIGLDAMPSRVAATGFATPMRAAPLLPKHASELVQPG